jgi:hypothetical protein
MSASRSLTQTWRGIMCMFGARQMRATAGCSGGACTHCAGYAHLNGQLSAQLSMGDLGYEIPWICTIHTHPYLGVTRERVACAAAADRALRRSSCIQVHHIVYLQLQLTDHVQVHRTPIIPY